MGYVLTTADMIACSNKSRFNIIEVVGQKTARGRYRSIDQGRYCSRRPQVGRYHLRSSSD